MPLEQPRRRNPLMRRYFEEIGLPGKRLAARAGVSHSQMYMARERHVGARNAEKIARAVANILALSAEEELELKAEIMGEPANLLRVYLGNAQQVAEALDEHPNLGWALISGKPISHKAGTRILEKLEARGAPQTVIFQVQAAVKPPPSPPGRVTYTLTGDAVREQRERARERLEAAKPHTHAAIAAYGLSHKEIRERAGVGRETLRQALYHSCGEKSAVTIAAVLSEASDIPAEEIKTELLRTPEEILKDFRKKFSETR